jgi:membrane-associated protease RseP (regulator of RpoE activity)
VPGDAHQGVGYNAIYNPKNQTALSFCGEPIMRATAFAAALLFANLAFAQPSSLSTLEQGLQSPAAPGGAAAGTPNGYLGAELDDVGENGHGVRVKSVKPGTPAEVSGLKANDLIVDIDGKKITNLNDYDAVAIRPAGAKMVFKVDRGGRQQSLAVTLGTRGNTAAATVPDNAQPEPPAGAPSLTAPGGGPSAPTTQPGAGSFGSGLPSPSTAPSLTPPGSSSAPPLTLPSESSPRSGGITAQPLDTLPGPSTLPSAPSAGGSGSGRASLGIKVGTPPTRAARRGAYVEVVHPGTPAAMADLPVGAVIVQMDAQKINSDQDLINAIGAARPGQEVELSYYDSTNKFGKKTVRLGEAGAAPGSASAPSAGGFGGPSGGFGAPGGFGSATAQNPAAAPPETPARGGIGGGGRPLINRVEQMAENFGRGGGLAPGAPLKTTTVYDPLAMAALQRTVQDLMATVNSLEERIRALEGKAGIASPPAGAAGGSNGQFGAPTTGGSPSFGSPQTPGFGSPSPSLTPGFGPSGTNP